MFFFERRQIWPPLRGAVTESSTVYSLEKSWVATAEFKRIELRARSGSRVGSGYVARKEAQYLLNSDLDLAELRAKRSLAMHSDDIIARYLLGAALLRKGELQTARTILQPLAESQPQFAAAWSELGLTLQKLGENSLAIGAHLQAVSFDPVDQDAWYALGDLLQFPEGEKPVPASLVDETAFQSAARALLEEQLESAEATLRAVIETNPTDAKALKLLADVLICSDRWAEARIVLERTLESAPHFLRARFRYASMLTARKEYLAAIPHILELLKSSPNNLLYRLLNAIALEGNADYQLAMSEYERILEASPDRPGLWMQYAQIVKAKRPEKAPALFDKVLGRFPFLVDASYALATLKSFRLDDSWIERIRAQFDQLDLDVESRAKLNFVLGKGFEDLRRYESSFEHYKRCNDIQRSIQTLTDGVLPGGPEEYTWKAKTIFTRRFLAERAGSGCKDTGAIFVVGLPRSGSTLVEQILSSHSAIEGLGELLDLPLIIDKLSTRPGAYPNSMKTLEFDRFRAVGEEYMALTRARRKSDKPFFTDKLPINHAHTVLIHLMLPNAKIVDVRRHPLDCGFSCYKHYFSGAQTRALGRRSMGRWYAEYVELMAHFDEILPGRIHRVIYEHLVENPEEEVRRLLDHVGLRFEEQCLRFHETERVVNTISAEQVRMPLYKSGVAHWRHYEQWLEPMKEELGYVLETYPEPPIFYPRLRARFRPRILGSPRFYRHVKGTRQLPFKFVPLASSPAE